MEKLPQRNLLLPNAPITPFSNTKKSKHPFKQLLSAAGKIFCLDFNERKKYFFFYYLSVISFFLFLIKISWIFLTLNLRYSF